jgi:hypothetical protein
MNSGKSASIGGGGRVAASTLPTSQTARIGTSTSPTPSIAAARVRSRWPGTLSSPRPNRWRSLRPSHHNTIVSAAHSASGIRSWSPDCRPLKPSRPQVASAAVSVRHAPASCGPSLAHTLGETGESFCCRSVRSTTSPRSLVMRSSSWSARAMITSHCLTRLSLIVAWSVSRSRSALTASVSAGWSAPGLTLERRQQALVSARSLRASCAAAWRRGAHVGRLLAQRIDLGRQDAGLVGRAVDAVELAGPQVDQLRERALRRRHGSAPQRPRRRASSSTSRRDGKDPAWRLGTTLAALIILH